MCLGLGMSQKWPRLILKLCDILEEWRPYLSTRKLAFFVPQKPPNKPRQNFVQNRPFQNTKIGSSVFCLRQKPKYLGFILGVWRTFYALTRRFTRENTPQKAVKGTAPTRLRELMKILSHGVPPATSTKTTNCCISAYDHWKV